MTEDSSGQSSVVTTDDIMFALIAILDQINDRFDRLEECMDRIIAL